VEVELLTKVKLMKTTKKAFTMIELVFVIVILGILSSIAISKMAVTRDDAMVVKGRSQVAAIRNAIALVKSKNMMEGKATFYPTKLDNLATATATTGKLFDSDGTDTILDYPVYAKDANGHWKKTATDKYAYKVLGTDVVFKYDKNTGSFDCHNQNNGTADANCKLLTE